MVQAVGEVWNRQNTFSLFYPIWVFDFEDVSFEFKSYSTLEHEFSKYRISEKNDFPIFHVWILNVLQSNFRLHYGGFLELAKRGNAIIVGEIKSVYISYIVCIMYIVYAMLALLFSWKIFRYLISEPEPTVRNTAQNKVGIVKNQFSHNTQK